VSQNLLNTTGIQALIVILISTLARSVSGDTLTVFDVALVSLIGVSLTLQFTIFVLLVILARSKDVTNARTETLNTVVTSLTGLLLIISSAVSVLGTYSSVTTGAAASGASTGSVNNNTT